MGEWVGQWVGSGQMINLIKLELIYIIYKYIYIYKHIFDIIYQI